MKFRPASEMLSNTGSEYVLYLINHYLIIILHSNLVSKQLTKSFVRCSMIYAIHLPKGQKKLPPPLCDFRSEVFHVRCNFRINSCKETREDTKFRPNL